MTTLLQSTQNTTVASHEAGMVVSCSASANPFIVEHHDNFGWHVIGSFDSEKLAKDILADRRARNEGERYRLIRLSAVVVE